MAGGRAMEVYREGGLQVLFKPVPKRSTRLPYVFLWAVDVRTFKVVDDPAFLEFVVLVLGFH